MACLFGALIGLLLSAAMIGSGCSRVDVFPPPTPEEVARENARSAVEGLANLMRLRWADVVEASGSGDLSEALNAREDFAKSGAQGIQLLVSQVANAAPDDAETVIALEMLDYMLPAVEDVEARRAAVECLLNLRDRTSLPEGRDRCTASLRTALDLAIAVNPEDPDVLMYRGDELLSRQEYALAIVDFTKAIDLRPAFANAIYLRGLAHHGRGDDQQAIVDYSSVLEIKADYADVMVSRAVSHLALRAPEKAVEDLAAALAREPGWVHVYELRAKAYETLGEENKAQADRDAATVLGARR